MRGATIHGYTLTRMLGEGSYAEVWEAEQRLRGRDHQAVKRVAVKILKVRQPRLAETLEAEAAVLVRLQDAWSEAHPGTMPPFVRLENVGQVDGRAALVLELLQGESLTQRLERQPGRWEISAACALGVSLLDALAFAHRQEPPVVHRDIKPANLFLTAGGGVRVLDFGVAKLLAGGNQSSMILNGTPLYMSPEAWGLESSPARDVYSAGLVLWELLAGRPACPRNASQEETRDWHRKTGAPNLRLARPEVPVELASLVWRMCARDPSSRYRDAFEAAEALKAIVARSRDVRDTIVVPDPPDPGVEPKDGDGARSDREDPRRVGPQPRAVRFEPRVPPAEGPRRSPGWWPADGAQPEPAGGVAEIAERPPATLTFEQGSIVLGPDFVRVGGGQPIAISSIRKVWVQEQSTGRVRFAGCASFVLSCFALTYAALFALDGLGPPRGDEFWLSVAGGILVVSGLLALWSSRTVRKNDLGKTYAVWLETTAGKLRYAVQTPSKARRTRLPPSSTDDPDERARAHRIRDAILQRVTESPG